MQHLFGMRSLATGAVLLLCSSSAWSAIAGLPEPPTPRELPQAWFAINDDMFGDAILDTDDFRTGNFNAGWAWDRLVIAADYSALTHRLDPSYENGTRSDEITLTLGMRVEDWLPRVLRDRTLLIAGIGTRVDGNMGGEVTQNAIHRTFGFPQTNLTYDHHGYSSTALGYLYGSIDSDAWHPGNCSSSLVAQFTGEAAASLRGEFQEAVGLTVALIGDQGSAWIGCDYQWNRGRQASPTAAVVAEHEAGTWLTVGLAKRDSLYLSAGVDLSTRGVAGTIGYVLDAEVPGAGGAQACSDTELALTQEELEYFLGSGALGLQVRGDCLTSGRRDAFDGDWACAWMIDYHFGTDQDYQWLGNRVDVDQFLVGLEPSYTLRPDLVPLQVQPYAVVGVGARFERVKVVSAGAHRFDQATAGAAVVQPGAGVRVRWCSRADDAKPHWYNLIWFGYGYDFWHPLWQAQVSAGADHADYLRPGMGGHYLIGWTMAW